MLRGTANCTQEHKSEKKVGRGGMECKWTSRRPGSAAEWEDQLCSLCRSTEEKLSSEADAGRVRHRPSGKQLNFCAAACPAGGL